MYVLTNKILYLCSVLMDLHSAGMSVIVGFGAMIDAIVYGNDIGKFTFSTG